MFPSYVNFRPLAKTQNVIKASVVGDIRQQSCFGLELNVCHGQVFFDDVQLREARRQVKSLLDSISASRQHACTSCKVSADGRSAKLDWKKGSGYNSVYLWVKARLSDEVSFRLELLHPADEPRPKRQRRGQSDEQSTSRPAAPSEHVGVGAASANLDIVSASCSTGSGSTIRRSSAHTSSSSASVQSSLRSWLMVKVLSLQRQTPQDAGPQDKHYTVKNNKFGHGAFGLVSIAVDERSHRLVCLKKQQKKDFTEFFKELAFLVGLDHPNVVEIFDAFIAPSLTLVLAFAGDSLKARLQVKPFATEAVPPLIQQLLAGLSYLSQVLVVHCDLKPANVCIDEKDHLRIVDFGCSIISMDGFRCNHFIKDIQQDGLRYVTLWYRSPEVLLGGDNFSFPSDVWSAGCIWAEMLTGKALFYKESSQWGMLVKMFQMLGSPTGDCLRCFSALPLWSKKFPVWSDGDLFTRMGSVPSPMLQDLMRVLRLSPSERLSASAAFEVLSESSVGALGGDALGGSTQRANNTPAVKPGVVTP